MTRNLSGVSFLTTAAKPDIMTKRQIKEREKLNESRRAEGNRANSAGGEENAPGKKKEKWERESQRKEKHHPFSADTNTYSNKSSAIDFTARENLCSMRELFSATIHCDHLS